MGLPTSRSSIKEDQNQNDDSTIVISRITIVSGRLGINVSPSLDPMYTTAFQYFTGASDAEQQAAGTLKAGMILTHVNEVDQIHVTHEEMKNVLGVRPCKLRFVESETVNIYLREKEDCERKGGCMIAIPSGCSLGIHVCPSLAEDYMLQFRYFWNDFAKEQAAGKLSPGMVLTHVNTSDQLTVAYCDVEDTLRDISEQTRNLRNTSACFLKFAKGDEPKYHPELAFPVNGAAKFEFASEWLAMRGRYALKCSSPDKHIDDAGNPTAKTIDFGDIQAATNNFDPANEIGEGGSCRVYKGDLFGVPCAIKVFSEEATEWETKQFQDEITILTNVKHHTICQLYGCVTNGPQQCVVLELMDVSLDDRRDKLDSPLGFEQKVWIALSVCRGIVHLHSQNPPLIHRDVSRILHLCTRRERRLKPSLFRCTG
jgi:hypothetical protein